MAEVALSTMWGIGQFPSLDDFFRAGRAVGFARFELNHAVDSRMLKDVNLNGYQIPSVHEPCPADVSVGALKAENWLISAPDEDDRKVGVAAIQRSIDLAHRLGAKIVIVHPGRVDIDTSGEARLYALYREGKSKTSEYAQLRQQLIGARAAQSEVNLLSVRRSLMELADYAGRRGLRLGLENRFYYHEIPLPDELELLLAPGYGEVIGYWHDVGHAQVLENLGFNKHAEWLQRFSSRIIGTHLHDVIGIGDHRAAGSGAINWEMVARYLPENALRTCEFQNDNSAEQVTAGVEWLVQGGIVRNSPN
jgi:sugar phosphate isomerase/epimerase